MDYNPLFFPFSTQFLTSSSRTTYFVLKLLGGYGVLIDAYRCLRPYFLAYFWLIFATPSLHSVRPWDGVECTFKGIGVPSKELPQCTP